MFRHVCWTLYPERTTIAIHSCAQSVLSYTRVACLSFCCLFFRMTSLLVRLVTSPVAVQGIGLGKEVKRIGYRVSGFGFWAQRGRLASVEASKCNPDNATGFRFHSLKPRILVWTRVEGFRLRYGRSWGVLMEVHDLQRMGLLCFSATVQGFIGQW